MRSAPSLSLRRFPKCWSPLKQFPCWSAICASERQQTNSVKCMPPFVCRLSETRACRQPSGCNLLLFSSPTTTIPPRPRPRPPPTTTTTPTPSLTLPLRTLLPPPRRPVPPPSCPRPYPYPHSHSSPSRTPKQRLRSGPKMVDTRVGKARNVYYIERSSTQAHESRGFPCRVAGRDERGCTW